MGEYYVAGLPCSDELYHHGILKQRWHVRRFQNPDGSLTPAGRERYGVGKERAKQAIKNAGAKAGAAAKSAASYAAKREKMKHPSLMSDDELRNYTQRLIAEKNYSDLLRYQRSNSGLGRAKQYVTDILKRGGGTIADAAFRRLANRISKSNSEAALEKLQREQAKQNIRDQLEDHERKRQIDMLTQQNRISDLQDQLADDSTSQKRELERLQRESQISNLRNQLDQNNIDMQRQINELTQQKQLKELQKALDPDKNGGGLAAAMRIIGDPNSSASQIQDAKQILQNYNMAQTFMGQIAARSQNASTSDSTSSSTSSQNQNAGSPSASPAPSQPQPSVDYDNMRFPTRYGENQYQTPAPGAQVQYRNPDYSNYRMNSVDGTNGGMYGGRVRDERIPTVEQMSNPYTAPSPATNQGYRTRTPIPTATSERHGPSPYADRTWQDQMEEDRRRFGRLNLS